MEIFALGLSMKLNVIVHEIDMECLTQIFHEPQDKYRVVHIS